MRWPLACGLLNMREAGCTLHVASSICSASCFAAMVAPAARPRTDMQAECNRSTAGWGTALHFMTSLLCARMRFGLRWVAHYLLV
jgi:hypothetical protein